MDNLTKDSIAIDTNIFEHLLNPRENTNRHIDQLLKQLCNDKIKLLVDDKRRITDEYHKRLTKRIQQINDDSKKRRLLRYWVKPENHKCITVYLNDKLMVGIKGIISEPQGKPGTDKFFVYVAFKQGRILITNDRRDMIDEGTQIGVRRQKLLKIPTSSGRRKGADILTSQQAYNRLRGDMIKSQANHSRRN